MGKHHLEYDSVEQWMAGENVPENFISVKNEQLRDKYITEFGELRRHLFAKHAATLSTEDQQKLKDREHPSQSHSFATRAEPYCGLLDTNLRAIGVNALDITLGWYHMDRIVLNVTLSESDLKLEDELPWLFQGFEIFYLKKQNESII